MFWPARAAEGVKTFASRLTIFVLAFALLPGGAAFAHDACEAVFVSAPRAPLASWADLPPVDSHALREKFKSDLLHHPGVQKLKKKYGDGESLTFAIPKTFRGHKTGWGIQGEFLQQVLQTVFPEARFTEGNTARGKVVTLGLFDSSMQDMMDNGFDILTLKAANPGPELPSKRQVRGWLNLPADARVASLYVSLTDEARLKDVVGMILKQDLADIVIVSMQKWYAQPELQERTLSALGVELESSVTWNQGSHSNKAVVFNQTRGRMPYLYRASDFAIVLGMGNGTEPLNAGVPVYVSRKAATGYDQNIWSATVQKATATGAGHAYADISELPELIRATSGARPRALVYEAPDADGVTPLDRLIETITWSLEN